jgi:hypothetical protein
MPNASGAGPGSSPGSSARVSRCSHPAGDRHRGHTPTWPGSAPRPRVIEALLAGRPLRGLTEAELATLKMPVGVLPSEPTNQLHQRDTVDALLRLLPQSEELRGCPEPPRPEFPPYRDIFLRTVTAFAR